MSHYLIPRIGMRVILTLSHATGRVKREALPPEFTGVIYSFDDNGADIRFWDHFGVAKEAHDVPLLATNAATGGYAMFCKPAPGEPEWYPSSVRAVQARAGDRELPTSPMQHLDKLICEAFGVPEVLPHQVPNPDGRMRRAVHAELVDGHIPRTVLDWATQADADLTMAPMARCSLEQDLAAVLNMHSLENGSNTPDYVLAKFLLGALDAFEEAVRARAEHAGEARALTYADHEAAHGHTEAWKLVVAALDQAMPGWCREDNRGSIMIQARDAILNLSEYRLAWKTVTDAADAVAPNWVRSGDSTAVAMAKLLTEAVKRSQKRELTNLEALDLARKEFGLAFSGEHWVAEDWVIRAIRAASRGEGGAS
jgi:hypothetical protein